MNFNIKPLILGVKRNKVHFRDLITCFRIEKENMIFFFFKRKVLEIFVLSLFPLDLS